VLKPLRQGGMGTLYLASDPQLDRPVAIKVIRADVDSADLRERFEHEARGVSRLRHPNIVTIYEFGRFDGHPYIAMEYIEGESMAELIRRRRPMSVADKARLMEQMCDGMARVHRAKIVHRDLKPDNVMIDSDTKLIKILDFGIARRLETDSTYTQGIGTPSYMAPEQLLSGRVDPRTDIWAMGAIFYELLSYRRPFEGDTQIAIAKKIVDEEPIPLARIDPGLDPVAIRVVQRALQKVPEQRYQTVDEMRADLSRIVQESTRLFPNRASAAPKLKQAIRNGADRPPIPAYASWASTTQGAQVSLTRSIVFGLALLAIVLWLSGVVAKRFGQAVDDPAITTPVAQERAQGPSQGQERPPIASSIAPDPVRGTAPPLAQARVDQRPTADTTSLVNAVAEGKVNVTFRSTGSSNGTGVAVELRRGRNAKPGPLRLGIQPGTILRSHNGSVHGILITGVLFRVGPSGSVINQASQDLLLDMGQASFVLGGLSIDFNKDKPSTADTFEMAPPDSVLAQTLRDGSSVPAPALQAAIWMHTNRVTLTSMRAKYPISDDEWNSGVELFQRANPNHTGYPLRAPTQIEPSSLTLTESSPATLQRGTLTVRNDTGKELTVQLRDGVHGIKPGRPVQLDLAFGTVWVRVETHCGVFVGWLNAHEGSVWRFVCIGSMLQVGNQ
jgi:predicted Ser/Thr protein kinase